MSGAEVVLWPDWSMRLAYSPKGTLSRPNWALNHGLGCQSSTTWSISMPWQLMQALAEKERVSCTSTPNRIEASMVMPCGAFTLSASGCWSGMTQLST